MIYQIIKCLTNEYIYIYIVSSCYIILYIYTCLIVINYALGCSLYHIILSKKNKTVYEILIEKNPQSNKHAKIVTNLKTIYVGIIEKY